MNNLNQNIYIKKKLKLLKKKNISNKVKAIKFLINIFELKLKIKILKVYNFSSL
jgi:hypothetical protein